MSGNLYILTGTAGCGKTTLLNSICSDAVAGELRTVKTPKYSERKERGADDDVKHDPEIKIGEYDIAYVMNKYKYGIKTKEIEGLMKKGQNQFIILSDFRIIRRLKKIFGEKAVTVYISSSIDPKRLQAIQEERHHFSPDKVQRDKLARQFNRLRSAANLNLWRRVFECVGELNEDWKRFIPEAESTEIRAQRIRAFHTRYIDNLELFDHVILNYRENKPEEMTKQMRNIILGGEKQNTKQYPPIFVVAAASGVGKGTLMEMLGLIGRNRVSLCSKLGGRGNKDNDKRDGMLAIGKPGKPPKIWPEWPEWWPEEMKTVAKSGRFPARYDLTWSFHKKSQQDQGIEYAVSSQEINRNLDNAEPQIFISNMGEFGRFRELYGDHVVFLFLHRLTSEAEMHQFQYNVNKDDPEQAEARIAGIKKVYQKYIEQIAEFDHVLLNTTYQEDLYDQMFQLLEFYHNMHLQKQFKEWEKSTA